MKKCLFCLTLLAALHGGVATAADLSFEGEGNTKSRACSIAAVKASKYAWKTMDDDKLWSRGYRMASEASLRNRCDCEKDDSESPPWSCVVEIDYNDLIISR